MLETITLVGALVGLATGAFTVWDRWVVRGRPLARPYIKVASWAHIGSAEAPESIATVLPEREDGVPAA